MRDLKRFSQPPPLCSSFNGSASGTATSSTSSLPLPLGPLHHTAHGEGGGAHIFSHKNHISHWAQHLKMDGKNAKRVVQLDGPSRGRMCPSSTPGVKAALPGRATPTRPLITVHCVQNLWQKGPDSGFTRLKDKSEVAGAVMRGVGWWW